MCRRWEAGQVAADFSQDGVCDPLTTTGNTREQDNGHLPAERRKSLTVLFFSMVLG